MSLENINKIDYTGIDNQTGNVILSIVDGVDWSDEQKHLLLLQGKINAYLSFIESGEICDSYPKADGRSIEIKIYAKYDIPIRGVNFLNKVSEVIENAGFKISWKVIV